MEGELPNQWPVHPAFAPDRNVERRRHSRAEVEGAEILQHLLDDCLVDELRERLQGVWDSGTFGFRGPA